MLQQLQQIFHSITKSLEVLYVIEGIKPCARILVFEDEIDKAVNFLNQNQTYTAISDFKVIKQTAQSEFYSDISIKIQKSAHEKGHFFVYLSKDEKIAQKAKFMEENNANKELGILLGYPECCCDFFANNFNEENADLTLKVLENSDGYEFPFYNNIAARHFDIGLLSHFPHGFGCMPSIEIAKNNLNAIKRHYEYIAALFKSILGSAVIYTANEGIFLLRNHKLINSELIYSDVLTTTKSKLYYLISSNKKLKVLGKNNFVISDVNFKGDNYGVMAFS